MAAAQVTRWDMLTLATLTLVAGRANKLLHGMSSIRRI